MPLTKKRGAIFPIYADTPTRADSENAAVQSKANSASRSPTKPKRPATALGVKDRSSAVSSNQMSYGQPRAGFLKIGSALKQSTSNKAGSVDPSKSSTPSLDVSIGKSEFTAPRRPLSENTTKRDLDIFSRLKPSTTQRPAPSETKPRRVSVVADKENAEASRRLDSPSSNTRSKTALSSTGGAASLSDPLTSPDLDAGHDTAPSAAEAAGTPSRLASLAGLVGDGRGALSLRKGRLIAGLLAEEGATDYIAQKSPSGKSSDSKRGRDSLRAAVQPDGPLADVSEAYGATGLPPPGFREQGK